MSNTKAVLCHGDDRRAGCGEVVAVRPAGYLNVVKSGQQFAPVLLVAARGDTEGWSPPMQSQRTTPRVVTLEIPELAGPERAIVCQSPTCQSVIATVSDEGILPAGDGSILSVMSGRSADVVCERRSCGTVTRIVWDSSPVDVAPRSPETAQPAPKPKRAPAPVPRVFPALAPRASSPMLTEEMMQVMQERWESFRIEKIRKRGTVAVGLRFDVFMRDGFRCRYCGASADAGAILHADHVIPESKGGPTTLENLVTACIDCNLGKSNKDLPD